SGTGGVYQVDGLQRGTVHATYKVTLDGDCTDSSCGDAHGMILTGADFILFPMGVDPSLGSPCRVELILPPTWKLVTPDGPMEPILRSGNLAALAGIPLLAGDHLISRTPGGELLAVQATGWTIGADQVAGLLAAYLGEQQRLLGGRTGSAGTGLMGVIPAASSQTPVLVSLSPHLSLLKLKGEASRPVLAGSLAKSMASLFRKRLQSGLAGADSPATLWWRTGFAEYTNLLAAVRSRTTSEEKLMDRLLEAWLNISSRSPLAGSLSLAAAGSRAAKDPQARAYVKDGGFILCFLLDLRLRNSSGGTRTLGDLLSATSGKKVSNQLLQEEASRLARTNLAPLFAASITGPGAPPLPDQAAMVGLELVDAGTGEVFTGMILKEEAPVIERTLASGPARNMGFSANDRIIAVDGVAIRSTQQVESILSHHAPGDVVEVKVKSQDGQMFSASLTLWETVAPTLRRSARASLAGTTAWNNLIRGKAAIFLN
ncbi:MAG: PDZ domain-containing protein, partial [Acidobacteriota bacterium]